VRRSDVDAERQHLHVEGDERGGSVDFVHVAPVPDEGNVALLVRIYVRPNEWGSDLGTRLLDRVERRLRDGGVERLRLSAFADNEVGVGFYESREFQRIEEREAEEFGVAEYVYEKAL
jgi:GNAT superfamily N-acetyltransferase